MGDVLKNGVRPGEILGLIGDRARRMIIWSFKPIPNATFGCSCRDGDYVRISDCALQLLPEHSGTATEVIEEATGKPRIAEREKDVRVVTADGKITALTARSYEHHIDASHPRS